LASIPMAPSDSIYHHHPKRRRAEASPGESEMQEDESDEGEETVELMSQDMNIESEDMDMDAHLWYGLGERTSPSAGAYKSVNAFLHDVHTLHQHRLLFSFPPPQKSLHHQISDRPPAKYITQLPGDATRRSGDIAEAEESERVKQRYEDTNKLLGSLVLSRRREIIQASVESHQYGPLNSSHVYNPATSPNVIQN